MISRRQFLKLGGALGTGLALSQLRADRTLAQAPTILDPLYTRPIINPLAIPKYQAPLPDPLAGAINLTGGGSTTITLQARSAQVLPPGFPRTPIWGYNGAYPGQSIIASSGREVRVRYDYTSINSSAHLLPVDGHVHGTMMGEPPVRFVAHLHGARNIDPLSDGYPDAWVTPDGKTIADMDPTHVPSIYTPANPGDFVYPNDQEAALLWYHDHALGITRLNVYAGMAALYVLRDANEQWLIDNGLIPAYPYEVPVVIQDRMFFDGGGLAIPDQPAPSLPGFQPWPGGPSIVPEFFGEVIVVNGVSWPFLEVEPRKYRVRFLNGSDSRFYELFLSSGQPFTVLGMEGGFLNAPVEVARLVLGPAERFDCIIDFAPYAGQTITLRNRARSPFPQGATVNPRTAGEIMQFRVTRPRSAVPDTNLPPGTNLRPRLDPLPAVAPPPGTPRRQLLLFEGIDEFGRLKPMLGTIARGKLDWFAPITENPAVGATEIWEIYNATPDAHPIHIHEVLFRIVNRQRFRGAADPITGVLPAPALIGQPRAPAAYEAGWKDTAIMYPGEVTRVMMTFNTPGLFVWHCHILSHEDHEMMRPYHIGPLPASAGRVQRSRNTGASPFVCELL